MCTIAENPNIEFSLSFNMDHVDKEIATFHKNVSKLLKKVDKNEPKLCYDKFIQSLKKIDHENLKK